MLTSLLLCLCWLRTHGLWLLWGLHFAWAASTGVLFGLPLGGNLSFSSVVDTRAAGSAWLTGGELRPSGGSVFDPVLLAAIPVRGARDPRLCLGLYPRAHHSRLGTTSPSLRPPPMLRWSRLPANAGPVRSSAPGADSAGHAAGRERLTAFRTSVPRAEFHLFVTCLSAWGRRETGGEILVACVSSARLQGRILLWFAPGEERRERACKKGKRRRKILCTRGARHGLSS